MKILCLGMSGGDMMVYNADRTCEGFIHYSENGKLLPLIFVVLRIFH